MIMAKGASLSRMVGLALVAACTMLGEMTGALAESPIRLHNYLLPDRLDDEQELGYNKLNNAIFAKTGETPHMFYAPLRRNAQNFEYDPGSCVSPSSIFALDASPQVSVAPDKLIESLPIDYVSVYIYTRKDQAKIRTRQALKGKLLGHMIGSVAEAFIGDAGAVLHAAPTEPQLIRMLDRDRVDAVMAFHPDLPIALDRMGHPGLNYEPELLVFRTTIHYVCHDTPETRDFIAAVDKAMLELRSEGSLKRFLGKHADIVPVPLPEGMESLN